MILDHSVASEEDFLIEVKRNKVKPSDSTRRRSSSRVSLQNNFADYDFYESSVGLLKQGFTATKFNYSNMQRKLVHVQLSSDEKYLLYEPIVKTSMDHFRPAQRKLKLKHI